MSDPTVERPSLPALPSDLVEGCPSLLVNPEALRALVEHRKALADCRRLQKRTADFYQTAREKLETTE